MRNTISGKCLIVSIALFSSIFTSSTSFANNPSSKMEIESSNILSECLEENTRFRNIYSLETNTNYIKQVMKDRGNKENKYGVYLTSEEKNELDIRKQSETTPEIKEILNAEKNGTSVWIDQSKKGILKVGLKSSIKDNKDLINKSTFIVAKY